MRSTCRFHCSSDRRLDLLLWSNFTGNEKAFFLPSSSRHYSDHGNICVCVLGTPYYNRCNFLPEDLDRLFEAARKASLPTSGSSDGDTHEVFAETVTCLFSTGSAMIVQGLVALASATLTSASPVPRVALHIKLAETLRVALSQSNHMRRLVCHVPSFSVVSKL